MSKDKKPYATLDVKAQAVNDKPSSKLEGPFPNGAIGKSEGARSPESGAFQKAKGDAISQTPKRSRGGLISHVFAGLVGGVLALGAGYFTLTQTSLDLARVNLGLSGSDKKLEDKVADLDRRLRTERLPSAGFAAGASFSQPELNELRARLDGIVQAARGLDEAQKNVNARLEALDHGALPESLQANVAAEVNRQTAQLNSRLGAIEQTIASVAKQQDERQVEAKSAALTLALGNLKRVVAEGGPFAAELAAVTSLAGNKLPLDQLGPYKDKGVPTLASLQREFPAQSHKVIENHYKAASGSLMGEVFSRAKAAIQIKPSDNEGTTLEAVLGRMEAALKAGNLKTVLKEARGLDGEAEKELRPWLAEIAARDEIEDALHKTDQDLYQVLARPSGRRS